MRLIQSVISLGCTILLVSCASTNANRYPQTVQTWQGAKTTAMVKKWGMPDVVAVSPKGNRVFVYQQKHYNDYHPGAQTINLSFSKDGQPYINRGQSTNNSLNHGSAPTTCVTLFEADKAGTIVSTRAEGVCNDAPSKAFQ